LKALDFLTTGVWKAEMTRRKARWVGYKHIDANYADAFERGESIQLATFEHYRNLEFERRDEMEGSARYHVDNAFPKADHPGWLAMKPLMDLTGAPPEMAVQMHNVTLIARLPPAYLFCCSWEPNQELIAKGIAVYEIADLRTFGKRLRWDNRRQLGRMQVGEVSYAARSGNPFAGETPPQGPFFKDPEFAGENELRLVFEAAPDLPPEPVIRIASPLAARLVRRIA
jgi:hypothetical protein